MADVNSVKAAQARSRMPRALRTLLILVAVAAAVIILFTVLDKVFAVQDLSRGNNTYGTGDAGEKAIFLAAEQYLKETHGYKVSRFTRSARFLPERTVVLCLDPLAYYTAGNESRELMRFVKNGGVLIMLESSKLTSYEDEDEEDVDDFFAEDGGASGGGSGGVDLVPDSAGGTGKAGTSGTGTDGIDGDGSIYVTDEEGTEYALEPVTLGGTVYYTAAIGQGRVYYAHSLDSLKNGFIKGDRDTAGQFLLFLENVMGECGSNTLLFDEYYAGIQSNLTADILGYGLILGFIELAVCGLVLLWSVGQRFGAPEPPPELEKREETEQIGALAKLYKRTGSETIGFRIHMEALMDDIAERLGLDEGTPYPEIAETAARHPLFSDCGLDKLVKVYNDLDEVRLSGRTLESYIENIDNIRRERLQ